MRFNLVEKAKNKKVGRIPIVQAPQSTCWDRCPFKRVCYGEAFPLCLHWAKVETRGQPLSVVCNRLLQLAPPRWRYGDVGDLPGKNGKISPRGLRQLVRANNGRDGWCYTHKPLTKENRNLIRWAISQGFTINISSEGWRRADLLSVAGVGPVFTVLPHNQIDHNWKRSSTPEGRTILRCPAERSEHITCATCGGSKGPLCARADRDFIIGVSTHGTFRNRVASIVGEIEMFGRASY